jgi:hypothetical protein
VIPKAGRYLSFALAIVCVAAATILIPSRATTHEIPTDIVIQSILKPGPESIDLLVRVPLEAMRDVNFPQSGPGYLVISEAEETIRDAAVIWIGREVRLFENDVHLDEWEIVAARLSLPSDRSFESYELALESFDKPPLPDDTELFRDQALLDVLLRYPIVERTSDFFIDPEFARLGMRTTTVVHFLPTDGVERVFEFSGDPGLVRLDPRWYHAFFRFVGTGIEHILSGVDHLLFVICLLIPFRRIRPMIAIITSFTVAHSITLFASAFGLVPDVLWFPPLIETLIAASIVYMAFENIVGSHWQRRWVIAFGFGLVHGFGFSFALSETLQFAGRHLLTSLLAFNIGVEIGQLLTACHYRGRSSHELAHAQCVNGTHGNHHPVRDPRTQWLALDERQGQRTDGIQLSATRAGLCVPCRTHALGDACADYRKRGLDPVRRIPALPAPGGYGSFTIPQHGISCEKQKGLAP